VDESFGSDDFRASDPEKQVAAPPHAAPARVHHEAPLAAAERLVADSASALTDEQVWDTYSQIDDERKRSTSSVSFIDRLTAGERSAVQVRVGVANHPTFDTSGELVEVGDGWIRLLDGGATHIVAIAAIISVAGLSNGRTTDQSGRSRRSWASLLRELAPKSSVVPIKLLQTDGASIAMAISGVGRDYLDMSPELGLPGQPKTTLTVGTRAIVMLTSRTA